MAAFRALLLYQSCTVQACTLPPPPTVPNRHPIPPAWTKALSDEGLEFDEDGQLGPKLDELVEAAPEAESDSDDEDEDDEDEDSDSD